MHGAIGGVSSLGRSSRGKRGQSSQEAFYGSETKRALYHCNYCHQDISCTARVKCAVCPDFDLCLECFSVGVEIPPHSNRHDYRIVDNLSFPIFHGEWGADEELLLLEAIDIYGLGNWAGVSEHVGGKSAEACKKHYFEVYIDVDSFPLPTPAPELRNLSQTELRAGWVVPATPSTAAVPLKKKSRSEAYIKAEGASGQPFETASVRGEEDEGTASGQLPAAGAAAAASGAAAVAGGEGGPGQQQQPLGLDLMVKPDAGSESCRHERSATSSKAASHHQAYKERVSPPAGSHDKAERHVQVGARSMQVTFNSEAAASSTPLNQRMLDLGSVAPSPVAPDATAVASTSSKQGATTASRQAVTATPVAATPGAAAATGGVTSTPGKELSRPQPSSSIGIDHQTGYHARRYEFDPDYDNDAEMTIADMEFTENDTEEDRQRKLRVLDIYNVRLDERERRREWLLSRGLINLRKAQALEKKRTAGERETVARLRVFAGYEPAPGAHDELVDGVLIEQRLRARIQELSEYRRNGLRTFADAEVFDSDRRRLRASSAAALVGSAGTSYAIPPAMTHAPMLIAGNELLPFLPPFTGGLFKAEEMGSAGEWEPNVRDASSLMGFREGGSRPGRPRRSTPPPQPFGVSGSDFTNLLADGAVGVAVALPPSSMPLRQMGPAGAPPPCGNRAAAAALQGWRNRRGVALDVSFLPGVELLQQRERELCASICMLPSHYLALKDMMMRDSIKHGSISRTEARNFFRLDSVRSLRLYDLWVSCGWVKTPHAANSTHTSADDGEGLLTGGTFGGGEDVAVEPEPPRGLAMRLVSYDVAPTLPPVQPSKPREQIVLNL